MLSGSTGASGPTEKYVRDGEREGSRIGFSAQPHNAVSSTDIGFH